MKDELENKRAITQYIIVFINEKGKLVIFSPQVQKDNNCKHLLSSNLGLEFSVSPQAGNYG